jgi:D-erythronate 2-dehydrogenase
MKALIIGAAGMIGRKFTGRLVRDGTLAGRAITHAHLVDIVAPQAPANAPFPVALDALDIAAPYVAPKLVAPRPDVIFLLASVVSGEAEADFDKGYAINLGGTHALFEAIRREQALAGGAYRPPCMAPLFRTRSATNSSPPH